MLTTLFGELAPARMPGDSPALAGGDAAVATAIAPPRPAAPIDVVVDASPALAIRAHFADSRADLEQANAMITLLDPSRLWAPQVIHALAEASGQGVERLNLRERGTLRTLAVVERTLVPRRGSGPLKVYHADIRANGLEQEEIANALAEGSHLTAVIIGAMQPHAVVALLRSLHAATREPEWRCPWLVFILPPGVAALRQRILEQDWPPQVRVAAMTESLTGPSTVWNTVLTAWEAAALAADKPARPRVQPPAGSAPPPAAPAPALPSPDLARALAPLARSEGLLACGIVDLVRGDLLATASTADTVAAGGDLGTIAHALVAARRSQLQAGPDLAAPDELLVTAGSQHWLLRGLRSQPGLAFVAVLERARANLALLRFRLLEAERLLG